MKLIRLYLIILCLLCNLTAFSQIECTLKQKAIDSFYSKIINTPFAEIPEGFNERTSPKITDSIIYIDNGAFDLNPMHVKNWISGLIRDETFNSEEYYKKKLLVKEKCYYDVPDGFKLIYFDDTEETKLAPHFLLKMKFSNLLYNRTTETILLSLEVKFFIKQDRESSWIIVFKKNDVTKEWIIYKMAGETW